MPARKKHKAQDGAMTADFHTTPEGPVTTAAAVVDGPSEHANDVERAFAERPDIAQQPAAKSEPKFSLLRQFQTFNTPDNRVHVGKNDKVRTANGSTGAFIIYFDKNPNEGRAPDDPHPVIKHVKDAGYRWDRAPDGERAWMKPYDQGNGWTMRQEMDASDVTRKAAELLGATVEQGQAR